MQGAIGIEPQGVVAGFAPCGQTFRRLPPRDNPGPLRFLGLLVGIIAGEINAPDRARGVRRFRLNPLQMPMAVAEIEAGLNFGHGEFACQSRSIPTQLDPRGFSGLELNGQAGLERGSWEMTPEGMLARRNIFEDKSSVRVRGGNKHRRAEPDTVDPRKAGSLENRDLSLRDRTSGGAQQSFDSPPVLKPENGQLIQFLRGAFGIALRMHGHDEPCLVVAILPLPG